MDLNIHSTRHASHPRSLRSPDLPEVPRVRTAGTEAPFAEIIDGRALDALFLPQLARVETRIEAASHVLHQRYVQTAPNPPSEVAFVGQLALIPDLSRGTRRAK